MPVDVMFVIGVVAAFVAIVAFVFWLLFFTPLIRWTFYGVVCAGTGYLALQVALLPLQHARFRASGGRVVRMLPEELLSKLDVTFTTEIQPGEGIEQFALNVRSTIRNNSDRVIEGVRLWCRVEKMSSGDSETASNWFEVVVRPGETKAFSGRVSGYLTGSIKVGFGAMQPPQRHFCRLSEVGARSASSQTQTVAR